MELQKRYKKKTTFNKVLTHIIFTIIINETLLLSLNQI